MFGRKYDFLKRKCDGLEKRIDKLETMNAILTTRLWNQVFKITALCDYLGVEIKEGWKTEKK